MKIAVIVASIFQKEHYCGHLVGNREEVRKRVDNFVRPDTEVDFFFADYGPETNEGIYDRTLGSGYAVMKGEWAAQNGYDAVVVTCGSDPGVPALKCALDIPVVGPGEASQAIASILGNEKVEKIFPRGIRIIDFPKDWEKVYESTLEQAKKAVANGATVLILGCTGLQGLGSRLTKEVGVPVLEGEGLALALAQLFVDVGLLQSRAAFRKPYTKKRKFLKDLERISDFDIPV